MYILITGAAGMIGRKLTARLVRDGVLNGRAIDRMTLTDIVAPELPAGLVVFPHKPELLAPLAGTLTSSRCLSFRASSIRIT